MSRLEGASPGTTVAIRGTQSTALPRSEKLGSKATGQYEFKAMDADGNMLYGILPLRVSGGKMAGSILLFAPALFIGGFRDVFPYYQFDTGQKVLRYKSSAEDEWRVYTPIGAEMERARIYFDTVGSTPAK